MIDIAFVQDLYLCTAIINIIKNIKGKSYVKKIFMFVILGGMVTSLLFAAAEWPDEIEFKGLKRPALGFIMRAQLNPKKDPFSTTEVIRYDEATSTFTILGTVLTISEASLREISKGNFVFTPFYKLDKTHLNPSEYEEVGALIIGTQDKSLVHRLHFASMHKLVDSYRKSASSDSDRDL